MLQKIFSSTLSQITTKALTAIISIVLLSILTNYLTLELFGLYNRVYNYLGIFAFLADMGLYAITIREITHNPAEKNKIVGNVLTLRGILGCLTIALSLIIAFFLPSYNDDLTLKAITIVGFFTLVSLLNSSLLAFLQAHMKIEFNLFSTVFSKVLNVSLIAVIVFLLFPKTEGVSYDIPFLCILIAGLIGIVCNTLLNFYYARKIAPIEFLFDTQYIKHIIKITLPYGIALFLSVVYFKVDIMLLSILETKETADISIALYSLPMKIVEVLMVVGGFYLNSILPSLSKSFAEKSPKEASKLIEKSLQFLFIFGAFILIEGLLFKEHIITLIANKQYLNSDLGYTSADVFSVVLFVVVVYFIASIFNYILIASKQEKSLLKINGIVTVINIIGNILVIPKYSFMGSAYITLLSQVVLLFLGWFTTRKILSLQYDYPFYMKVLCIGCVTFALGKLSLQYFGLGVYGDLIIYGNLILVIFGFLCFLFIPQIKQTIQLLKKAPSQETL